MEMYTFEDLETKKLVREVGERMDEVTLTYLDLMIEVSEELYPEGLTDDNVLEFYEYFSNVLFESLEKACDMRGL